MSSSASRVEARTELRVVILADDEGDASQIEQTLRSAKLAYCSAHADGRESFIRVLRAMQPDLVIAFNGFAGLDSRDAIGLVHNNSPGVPVIVVDGAFSEESAVKLAGAGAIDYVSRDGLARLAFAIEQMSSTVVDARLRRHAERDLAFNAAVLEAVQEASPDGILVVDENANIVSINRRFMEMWRIPESMAASREDRILLDFVADQLADSEAFLARVRDLYRHPKEKGVDEIALKDGRIFYRYTAPTERDGIYLGRVWFFHDITAYKKAEWKIQEDASQFRGLVEQELAGIFILSRSAAIDYVNPRFLEMLGYSLDDVLGKPVIEFVAEEDWLRVARDVSDLTSGARKSTKTTLSLHRKDGNFVPILAQATIATYQGQTAIMGVTLDISELRSAQKELERTNRILKTLSAGNSALVRATTESALLHSICRAVIDAGGFKFTWIGFAQQDRERSVLPVAWANHNEQYLKSLMVSWSDSERGRGPTGTAIRTGETVVNQNFATNPDLGPWREEAIKNGFGSSIAVPLKDGAKTFGAITIYAMEPDAFSADEVCLLTELAGDLSYGILSLRARIAQEESVRKLRHSMQATVQAIASTLERRDPYTAGHQRAVAQLASAIARNIGVPEDEIEGIYLAGVVHDIGKIQVPSEILAKPGKLTDLEYQLVQTHAQAGYDVIKGVEFPWPVADMILQHHERLDGSGYPRALKDDQILLGAKIIAVADVVQAMTARRPYRGALGLDAALAEVERNKGTKYFVPAVDACVDLFRNKGFKFESDFGHEVA